MLYQLRPPAATRFGTMGTKWQETTAITNEDTVALTGF